jgi:transcriptional regulator with GAF, ATPase, and Fis domain
MVDLPDEVLRDVTQLNELLRAQRSLSDKLEAVAEMVRDLVPGCDAVSVSLTAEESAFTGAATSQLAIEADLVQYRTGEGPCLDAAADQATIRIDALAHDESYEHFAPGAVEAGVESSLSIPLISDGHAVGSLNLYSRTRGAFPDGVPDRIADQVAYAGRLIGRSPFYAASADTLARLMDVVQQTARVEIAVGMLIFADGLTPDAAWDRLRELADLDGTSIVDCARRLVDEHERRLDHPDESGEN